MIKQRPDLEFLIITKRIHSFYDCIPDDWGDGYENVHICCTCENQDRADFRLPIFKNAPIKKKSIICEPILQEIDLTPYLDKSIIQVVNRVIMREFVAMNGFCHYGNNAKTQGFPFISNRRAQDLKKTESFIISLVKFSILRQEKLI